METVTIKDLFQELKKIERKMITKKEFNSLVETIEIASNKETMEQISDSEKDIQSGNIKEVNFVKDIF